MTEAEWFACNDPKPMLDLVRGKASERKLRLFAIGCVMGAWEVLEHESPNVTKCCRLAVEMAERHQDGLVDLETMRNSRAVVSEAVQGSEWVDRWCVEAALAVTEPEADIAGRMTANLLGQIEDFAEAQADTTGVSGLCVVCSRDELARLIEHHRAQDLPLGWDWERTYERWETIRNANPWAEDARRVSRKWQAATLRDIVGNPFHSAPVANPGWLSSIAGPVRNIAQAVYDNRAFGDLPILADALEESGCGNDNILAHCRQLGEHVRGCWVVDLLLGKK